MVLETLLIVGGVVLLILIAGGVYYYCYYRPHNAPERPVSRDSEQGLISYTPAETFSIYNDIQDTNDQEQKDDFDLAAKSAKNKDISNAIAAKTEAFKTVCVDLILKCLKARSTDEKAAENTFVEGIAKAYKKASLALHPDKVSILADQCQDKSYDMEKVKLLATEAFKKVLQLKERAVEVVNYLDASATRSAVLKVLENKNKLLSAPDDHERAARYARMQEALRQMDERFNKLKERCQEIDVRVAKWHQDLNESDVYEQREDSADASVPSNVCYQEADQQQQDEDDNELPVTVFGLLTN